ncbi:hypothetical protein [Ruegeria sp.]|uniref:hypothetical protein n=1 Tax=Ruegeria sp. TaxID=1879320 RepID=UPI002323D978|nr:hypothetical protein [Ruegeria sp.]MDA7965794.1 hypothetical protein [Ruegeria sp.]
MISILKRQGQAKTKTNDAIPSVIKSSATGLSATDAVSAGFAKADQGDAHQAQG